MITTGACVPSPGLHKATGTYALCYGTFAPVVLVDPLVRTKPGEQALVAHEYCHAIERHGLRYNISRFAVWLHASVGIFCCFAFGWISGATVLGFGAMWAIAIPFLLRDCEKRADEWALFHTTPAEFVSFMYLHPHPKGRWARWLYGKSIDDRIRRVLSK